MVRYMMKGIIFIIFIVLPYILCGQGIHFQELAFNEAIVKARQENKFVLLDCYTSWCGPCKKMATEVFTLKKAGDYFNDRFVSIKVDMEKGEGPEIAKRFQVGTYPTFIIFKSDGSIVSRFSGSCDIDGFIAFAEAGINSKVSYDELAKKYESGKMKDNEIFTYIRALSAGGEYKLAVEIANRLLVSAKERRKISKDYWFLYEDRVITPMESEHFDFIIQNKSKFDKLIGKERVEQKIFTVYRNYLYNISAGNVIGTKVYDEKVVQKIEKDALLLEKSVQTSLLAWCSFARARKNQDPDRMLDELAKFVDELRAEDLWGITSAFRGGLHSVQNKEKLREVGKKVLVKAAEKDKQTYISSYELAEGNL